MNIRKSTLQDLPQILNLYKIAREFMKNNGNPNQWEDRYPEVSTVENDIKTGISYVCVENGGIVGTFVFFTGEDPTYRVIENGEWHSDREPYGVNTRASWRWQRSTQMPFSRISQPYTTECLMS